MAEFVHLHNHSHYSLQDGAATIDDLLNAAQKHNMKSLALTDHGVLYGAAHFYKKAKDKGIKPIIGMEAYIVKDGSRFEKGIGADAADKRRQKNYNHLLLLAKNKTGYKNLVKLTSLAHTQGFYYRPRIDFELLAEYKEGLVCTSACAGGIVASDLINGDYEKAKQKAALYKELFGDDFYLEIQDHNIDYEKYVLEGMPKIAKELNIKLVATNDIHYIEKEHAIAHNILLLLGDKTGEADYNKLRYNTDQIYFKSAEEMIKLFKNYPGAVESTLEIDEKCNLELKSDGFLYPKFPIPENAPSKNPDDYFEYITRTCFEKLFDNPSGEYEDRLNFEIQTIKQMGYSGYFLIVRDFIKASKDMGIPVGPGRGSAAGCLVAYVLGITNIDPIKYNLLFERFLNPSRKSMPDIDVDFADDRRGEVIEYVKQKYGVNSVCQIVTFNKLSSKQVLRDVGRVLKISIPDITKINKHIKTEFGKVQKIDAALKDNPELKWLQTTEDPKLKELLKYARILEGMNRNSGKHASGIVIAPGEVSDYIPVALSPNSEDIVAQFDMKDLDNMGAIKMDFLGLRTLSIIADAITLIKKNYNIEINVDDIPLDDEDTYKIFAKGQTTAIFQFESSGMREFLGKLKPTCIEEIAAMNALYRPGPMDFIQDYIDRKFGKKRVEYLHPLLEPILKETYGIIVYQEQVIQIANKIAGMSLAEADILRRAMGKKDAKAMQEQKLSFIEKAQSNNVDKKTAEEIFDNIDKFANYGFNKSHAVAYSVVAYHTAYLKAHYPAEFLAANLKHESENTEKISVLLDECRKLKIETLPPDINKPNLHFDVVDGKIIYGMMAIKNVGEGAVEEIIRKRRELGRDFTSIYDFCANVDGRLVNKRVIESLVLAGAFDTVKGYRAQNFAAVEKAIDYGWKAQKSAAVGTESLFGESEDYQIQEPALPDVAPWESIVRLSKERSVLGVYLTDHPLRKYEIEYKSFASVRLDETEKFYSESTVRACGIITDINVKIDKKGNRMALFKLDDFSGSCECLMFSDAYEKYKDEMEEESPVLIVGKSELSGDKPKIQVEKLLRLEKAKFELTKKIDIYLNKENCNAGTLENLKNILEKYEGTAEVFIIANENGGPVRFFYLSDYKVKVCDELLNRLTEIFGVDSIFFRG